MFKKYPCLCSYSSYFWKSYVYYSKIIKRFWEYNPKLFEDFWIRTYFCYLSPRFKAEFYFRAVSLLFMRFFNLFCIKICLLTKKVVYLQRSKATRHRLYEVRQGLIIYDRPAEEVIWSFLLRYLGRSTQTCVSVWIIASNSRKRNDHYFSIGTVNGATPYEAPVHFFVTIIY